MRLAANRNVRVAATLASVAGAMLLAAYAAVPIYKLICEATGLNGTTQRAERAPGPVLSRLITVRFNSLVAPKLKWDFKPVELTRDIKIGSTELAFYEATNLSDKPVIGTATFNVTPEIAGRYFNKIECFCFKEQLLRPGETMSLPVSFFIDPAIVDDPDASRVKEITLSYTFFPLAGQNAEASEKKGGKGS
ncbi:MAG: cytochrome c oxidase assembly protein [Hyphomicrobiaceae bacterium]|nr:MAG: cytochrome c oxidase assembly protein [Hyphomicrobiaceae bacterium]